MIYFLIMIVSNNSLLNILLPKDNASLKEVLKEADVKTLLANNKGIGVETILKNLFSEVISQKKSNTTIHSLLKNSSVFKEMGNFTSQLKELLNKLPHDKKYIPLKNILQSFLTNIKDINETNLKQHIDKSGIFLESKLATNHPIEFNQKVLSVLNELKSILPKNENTKALLSNLDKLINSIKSNIDKPLSTQAQNEIKTLLTQVQSLKLTNTTKLEQLTSKLAHLSKSNELIQSKNNIQLQSNTEEQKINQQSKEILNSIKPLLQDNHSPKTETILKELNTLLKENNIFSKTNNLLEPKALFESIRKSPEIKQIIEKSPTLLQNIKIIENIFNQISELNGKTNTSANIIQEKNTSLLSSLKEQLSTLLNEVKNMPVQTQSKTLQLLFEQLLSIKNIFSKIPRESINQNILQMLSNTQQTANQPEVNTNLDSNNLNTLINALKTIPKQEMQILNQNLSQYITKLEQIIQSQQNVAQNQTIIQNDIKSVLLRIQEDLANSSTQKETLRLVDKLVTHLDYYQLLSVTSSSNFIYVPFIWDMLDEGSMSMKKIDEEQFFCEIHLKLKEFGQLDLMLGLYDKNNLDITVFSNKSFVKELIKENITQLKKGLNEAKLILKNIKIIDSIQEENKENKNVRNTYESFSNDLNFGVNIKV